MSCELLLVHFGLANWTRELPLHKQLPGLVVLLTKVIELTAVHNQLIPVEMALENPRLAWFHVLKSKTCEMINNQ